MRYLYGDFPDQQIYKTTHYNVIGNDERESISKECR